MRHNPPKRSYLVVSEDRVRGMRQTLEAARRLAANYADALVVTVPQRLDTRSSRITDRVAYSVACIKARQAWREGGAA